MPPTANHRQRRIIQISQAWGIELPPAPQPLTRPLQKLSHRIPQDEYYAEDLLKRRQQGGQASSPALRRTFTSRRKSWDQKELFDALVDHVKNQGSAGVAEVLIEKLLAAGGDINAARSNRGGLLSRRRSLESLGERGKLLMMAVETSQKEMVEILAPHADTLALDMALPMALRRADAAVAESLLRYGADLSQSVAGQEAFRQICAAGFYPEIILLIVRSEGRPSPALASQCLVDAARAGSLEMVLHLSRSIADGDFNNAEALQAAVAQGRQDIALVIIMGNKPPRQPGLDEAFTALFARSYVNPNEKLATAELLLCAGAGGEAVDIALIHSARSEFLEMVKLLVMYGASLEFDNSRVVRDAVAQGHIDILEALLSSDRGFNPVCASECIENIDKKANPEIRYSLLNQLLRKGAGGPVLSEALIDAVEDGDIESARLLVVSQFPSATRAVNGDVVRQNTTSMVYEQHEVASVDHKGGLALKIAVERGDVQMAKVLLGSRPNPEVLGGIAPIAQRLDPTTRYSIIEALLSAGLQGPPLDMLLHETISQIPRDQALLALLLSQGADPNVSSGSAITAAAAQGDAPLLQALVQRATPQVAAAAIPAAMANSGDLRRGMIGLLLSAGAASGAEALGGALVQILQEQPVDVRLLRMVLEAGADVNLYGGAALELAVNDPDHTIAELLLRYGKPCADLLRNGLHALAKLPSTQSKAAKLKALLRRADLRPSTPTSPPYPQTSNFAVHLTPADLNDLLPAEVSATLGTHQESRSLVPLQLLLSAGADINACNGQAVHLAIRAANEPITDILFAAKPSPQTLKAAMPYAVHIKSPMDRLAFTKRLLDAGTIPQEVNSALVFAVQAHPEDVALLKTLAEKADVSDPEALIHAVSKEHIDLVELLLQYARHPQAAIDAAMNRCMRLQNRAPRLEICRLLIGAGPSTDAISAALPLAAGEGDFILGKLLVEAGATLADDGQAIIEASRSGSAEMLAMMLASKSIPSTGTLEKAFQAATDVGDLTKRGAVFEVLLGKGVGGPVVNEQLVSAARYGDTGRELLAILVRAGADPNFNKGEAVCAAVRSAFLGGVEVLLGRADVGREVKPSSETLVQALKASWKLSWDIRYTIIKWLFESGLTITADVHIALNKVVNDEGHDVKLAKLLLAQGASPVVNGCRTFVDAASSCSLLFLPLLLDREIAQKDLDWVFAGAFTKENAETWFSNDGFTTAEMLLRKGAAGEGVASALSTVLELSKSPEGMELANQFVDLFVAHGVDVNYQNGLSLRLATSSGVHAWVEKLLGRKPTTEARSAAFLRVFDKDVGEEEALMLLHLFVDCPDGLDVHVSDGRPTLIKALEKYPRSTEMIRILLVAGFYHDEMTMAKVLPDIEEEEQVTILTWALLQPQKRISSSVIELLIARGASVNVETRASRVTPLMLAIQSKRQDIVKKLLMEGAEVDVTDVTGNTPLAMASALGGDLSVSLMRNLLAAGAPRNDGSLHNAARELNLPACQVLTEFGHDVDFPSHLHDGRSALAEVCLHASDLGELSGGREKSMEKVMNFLIDQGSDITLKTSNGKSILLLALEAIDPVSTTRVLLKCGMWKQINKSFNLYTDGKHTYSPTSYVQKLLESDHKDQLLSLLKANRCSDVFYANSGPQPDDATGLPEDLLLEERLRKARHNRILTENEDHALALARERERAAVQAQIYTTQAELEEARRRRFHQDEISQRQSIAALEEEQFNASLRRKRGERNAELTHQNALTDAAANRARALGQAQLEIEDRKMAKMLEWEEKVGNQKVDNERNMSAIRVAEREDVDRIDRVADERFRKRVTEQRRLVDAQGNLAGRLQQGGLQRRQVGYIMGEET